MHARMHYNPVAAVLITAMAFMPLQVTWRACTRAHSKSLSPLSLQHVACLLAVLTLVPTCSAAALTSTQDGHLVRNLPCWLLIPVPAPGRPGGALNHKHTIPKARLPISTPVRLRVKAELAILETVASLGLVGAWEQLDLAGGALGVTAERWLILGVLVNELFV